MNPKDIFVSISRKLADGDLEGAKTEFRENLEALYKENPLLTLKTNFELRFISNEFEQAYQDNEYFQALPYVSQEVEEYLRSLPRLIRANELSAFQRKEKTEEEIEGMLNPSTKNEELLFLVSSLGNKDITPYEDKLIALLDSPVHDDVKSFTLMLLASKGVNKKVKLTKSGASIELNPSMVGVPFQNADYNTLKANLAGIKDVTVADIARRLLDQWALYCYPLKPLLPEGLEATGEALSQLANYYLDNKSELGKGAKVIDDALRNVPPLEL